MIRNYIITTRRIIQRSPIYFGINLVGLSIGIICCVLIALFVQHELSYDQFHSRKDRLYRVNYDIVMGGNQTISPSVPVFVAPHLKRLFPEVEDATRFLATFSAITVNSDEDKLFDEKGFAWVPRKNDTATIPGGSLTEDYSDDLVNFVNDLPEEELRSPREGLTDNELEFSIYLKGQPDLRLS